jgi:DNA modification methylase
MKRGDRRQPFARLAWDRQTQPAQPMAALSLHAETYPQGYHGDGPAANRLILGDNHAVMAALLSTHEGRIDLIYADPPFMSGKAYNARLGRDEDSRRPSEWRTTQGFEDRWPEGTDYLNMLLPRLEAMYRLLAPTGTLYLHLDWHASAYARLMLDEIFGPGRILNEIAWIYHGPSPIRSAFKRKHDTILVYTKSDDYTFDADAVRVPYDPATVRTFASSPRAGFGKVPDLVRGKVPEDWWHFPVVARLHRERTGFPTQKPEALLERILLASSRPGDLVADFFCGSGTTPAVAARLGRSWLACDCSPLAIHTSYRRLLLLPECQPFSTWRTTAAVSPRSLQPSLKLTQQGPEVKVALAGMEQSTPEDPPFPDAVDLWEVDWDYNGRLFRSRSQAVRQWRSDAIGLTLAHQYPLAGRRRVRVRAADIRGWEGWAEVQVEVP